MDDLEFIDLSEKAIGSPQGLDRLWKLLDEHPESKHSGPLAATSATVQMKASAERCSP